jgi:CRP-like cAMP-binding protein
MIQGHLRRFPLFDPLTDEDVARLEGLMAAVRVRAGRALMKEGEATEGRDAAMFLVLEGAFDITARDARGTDRPVHTAGPGQLLGAVALAVDTRRTATCTAARPSLVARMTRRKAELLRIRDPVLYVKLQRVLGAQMAADLRALGRQLLDD